MNNQAPVKLYKYLFPYALDKNGNKLLNPDGSPLIPILSQLKIRFTPANKSNDPFETWPSFLEPSYAESYAYWKKAMLKIFPNANRKERREKASETSRKFRSLAIESFEKLRDKWGIFCLTENSSDLTMWSHYANEHKGFLICFNVENLNKTLLKIHDFSFWKVRYPPEPERIQISFIQKKEIQSGEMRKCLLTKSKEWKYENEWRVFALKEELEQPWNLFSIPGNCIEEIVLGLRIEAKDETNIKNCLKNNPELEKITIKKARMHATRFELNYE